MVKCGTSPAFNYVEVQGAIPTKIGIIHKMKVILKELKETKQKTTINKNLHFTFIILHLIFHPEYSRKSVDIYKGCLILIP